LYHAKGRRLAVFCNDFIFLVIGQKKFNKDLAQNGQSLEQTAKFGRNFV
jgi:hypothetical protein